MFLSMALAAALAASPADPNEADLQCVAIFANDLGANKDSSAVVRLTASLIYFIGRIDARAPGFDYEAGLRKMLETPDGIQILESQRARCGEMIQERGRFMLKLGDSLTGKSE